MSAIDHLNPQQKEAATKINGVIRAIAGPGTGKTAMKTARVAYMLEQGVEPDRIVALTFTNKAADEMRDRIAQQAGEIGYRVFAGTYHSFFIQKILKPNQQHEYFKQLGYKDGFIILDDNDSKRLMDQTIKGLPAHAQLVIETQDINKKSMLQWMSGWRAQGFTERDLLAQYSQDQELKDAWNQFVYEIRDMAKNNYTADEAERTIKTALDKNNKLLPMFKARVVWKGYTEACVRNEGIDFDDVLIHAQKLLQSDEELTRRLNRAFEYFSLDEYQDTNQVQYNVINTIAAAGNGTPNIFTVGDTRQSIYGFRKADVRLMSEMHKQYPDIQDVVLTTNYRSTDALLTATNALAKEMEEQITEGQLNTPEPKPGDKPVIAHFETEEEEATWIVDQIQAQIDNGDDVSQTAILYRSRALRASIEAELLSRDLSYDIIGDTSFWEKKEVRDMMSVIRFTVRENDDLALYRILENSSLPLTPLTARRKAQKEGVRPYFQLEQLAYPKSGRPTVKSQTVAPFLQRFKLIKDNLKLVDPTIDQYQAIDEALLKPLIDKGLSIDLTGSKQDLMQKMRDYARTLNRDAFVDVLHGLYEDYIWDRTESADRKAIEKKGGTSEELYDRIEGRRQNVRSVLKIFSDQLKKGLSLNEALDELTLRAEAQPERKKATVKLMTNHASKGLQFDKTYVIGAESQAYWRDENPAPADYNEEGRNFYVAITRAENNLAITTSATRFINGETKCHTPLPFIEHIEDHCHVIDKRSDYSREVGSNSLQSDTAAEQFIARLKM